MTIPIRASEASLIEVRQALQRLEHNRRLSKKNNFTATVDPNGSNASGTISGSTDDESLGYESGSWWYNQTTNFLFICEDATRNAAIWQNITGSSTTIAGNAYESIQADNLTVQSTSAIETLKLVGGTQITTVGLAGSPDQVTFDWSAAITQLSDVSGKSGSGSTAILSTITAIASGEILKWNGTNWINNTLAEAGVSPTGHTHIEADITDLDHTDTNAIHIGDSVSGDLSGTFPGDLTVIALRTVALDSTVGTPSDGNILVYRSAGTDWVLEAKPAGGGSHPVIADNRLPMGDGTTVENSLITLDATGASIASGLVDIDMTGEVIFDVGFGLLWNQSSTLAEIFVTSTVVSARRALVLGAPASSWVILADGNLSKTFDPGFDTISPTLLIMDSGNSNWITYGWVASSSQPEIAWSQTGTHPFKFVGDVDITSALTLGTALAIAEGGTASTTAQAAIDLLSAVSAATNEHVLTKDTGSGNAIWKAAAGGGGGDVTASANMTDHTIIRGDGGAKGVQDSGITIDDADDMVIPGSLHITHTALENDDHAFEIDCDAAGFGDVKALDIDYITGGIASGEDEAVILVNIDETSATGGDVNALQVLATEGGADDIHALFAGVLVAPIEQLSGAFTNADSILNKTVDVLTALSGGGAGNISVFVADNDTVTIGDAAKFEELEFIVDTAASGAGIAPTWEYSTGSGTWAPFSPVDGTNGFRNTGVVAWMDADIPTWAVGTGTEFLIRITRTRNSLTTTPILDKVQIAAATLYSWDKDGNVTIKTLALDTALAIANGGTNSSTALGGTAGLLMVSDGAGKIVETGDITAVGNVLDEVAEIQSSTIIMEFKNPAGEIMLSLVGFGTIVNQLVLSSSATGDLVALSVFGSDTDIGLIIKAKGSGNIELTPITGDVDVTAGNLIVTAGRLDLTVGDVRFAAGNSIQVGAVDVITLTTDALITLEKATTITAGNLTLSAGHLVLAADGQVTLGALKDHGVNNSNFTIDMSATSLHQKITLGSGNISVTFNPDPAGPTTFTFYITQDATTARTMTFANTGGDVLFAGGVVYVPTTTLGGRDKLTVSFDGTDYWIAPSYDWAT